ncbi:MAG: hypothetical protein E3K32_13415 [wastewater metagenome]|nr:hypothetical protein [Candidatus Loosdrechtia aerotolerans]
MRGPTHFHLFSHARTNARRRQPGTTDVTAFLHRSALKNKYDPTNFWRLNQNILPTVGKKKVASWVADLKTQLFKMHVTRQLYVQVNPSLCFSCRLNFACTPTKDCLSEGIIGTVLASDIQEVFQRGDKI